MKLNCKKNKIFLGLKFLESEILKNDSNYRSLNKYIKSINSVFEKYKEIKDLVYNEINAKLREDYLFQLKSFKKFNINNMRRFDIMNSLTLKSEYSEEFSEMASSILNEEMKNLINCVTETNLEIKDENSQVPNDTVNDIIQGLTRVKTEDEKLRMKNAKKIKSKKLKYSNANSDLDITDNKKLQKDIVPKIKSWNKDIKALKSKNSFNNPQHSNNKNTSLNSITSPRFGPRSNNISGSNFNRNSSNFSNTHTAFRTDSKNNRNILDNSNTGKKPIEKTQMNNLDGCPTRKLSEDQNELKETFKSNSFSPFKRFKDEYRKDSLKFKENLENIKEDNTFSPSTSSQCINMIIVSWKHNNASIRTPGECI